MVLKVFKLFAEKQSWVGHCLDDIDWDKCIAWLEKQGEQKETLCDKCKKEQPSHSCQDITALGRCAVEHEQKPADKVELKFKDGDWVTETDGETVFHITIDNNMYQLETLEGTSCHFSYEVIERKFRLWTIQDAKDGDVLSYRNGQWIFIYKGILTENTFKYYALLSEKDITINATAFSLLTSCIIPATKEQRNTLFAKMREAGYEWNAEKKELKKIEQKSENYKQQVMSEMTDLVKDYITQKPAEWSEEDEKRLNNTITQLKAASNIIVDDEVDNSIAFIKSLKDRVQPQPKQEWSEEDKFCIQALLRYCEQYQIKDNDRLRCLNWLKFLKDRCTWKPSDEQIKALETTLYSNMSRNDKRYSVLSEFVAELKKLREEKL